LIGRVVKCWRHMIIIKEAPAKDTFAAVMMTILFLY